MISRRRYRRLRDSRDRWQVIAVSALLTLAGTALALWDGRI
jgi:hypothetical protein